MKLVAFALAPVCAWAGLAAVSSKLGFGYLRADQARSKSKVTPEDVEQCLEHAVQFIDKPIGLMQSFKRLQTTVRLTNPQRTRIMFAHIFKKGSREHLVLSPLTGLSMLSSFVGKLRVISSSCVELLGCQIWDLVRLSISTSLHHVSQQ